MNVNTSAYGGYYSSAAFSRQKEEIRNNQQVSSAIGNEEMEAVLKEKDPELLEQIRGVTSKIASGERGYAGIGSIMRKAMDYVYEARKEMGIDFSKNDDISAVNEEKLSQKAQDYLKKLRKNYGNYDFMIGNSAEDIKALSKSGSKEFSVILSSAEIEKMANDEKYAEEKLQAVEGAVKMCKRICEENGYVSSTEGGLGENGTINKIGVSIDENGNMKLFAELEKSSARQRERLEKNRAKRAEEKKAAEKKEAEKTKRKNPYEKEEKPYVKRTTIEASSEEELIEKIKELDWSKITDSKSGDRIDFTV